MITTIIIFVGVLALLVLAHEFGHFYAARRAGVKVEEFGIGFPPRLFSITRGDTRYSLNLIPLGGFVKIFGEQGEGTTDPQSFASKSIFTRIGIVSAGVIMNVVLAYALLAVGFMYGLPTSLEPGTTAQARDIAVSVVSVLEGTPASLGGIEPGDRVVALDDTMVTEIAALQEYMASSVGTPVQVKLQRGKDEIIKILIPVILEETKKGGVGMGLAKVGIVSYSVPVALYKAGESVVYLTWNIVAGFITLVKDGFQGRVVADIAGPVGVAVMTGHAAQMGFSYLVQFMALLSLNLAVINFLPFPALDGGRAFIFLVEALRRRPMHAKAESMLHMAGFALLMLLVLVVTYRDVVKLF